MLVIPTFFWPGRQNRGPQIGNKKRILESGTAAFLARFGSGLTQRHQGWGLRPFLYALRKPEGGARAQEPRLPARFLVRRCKNYSDGLPPLATWLTGGGGGGGA